MKGTPTMRQRYFVHVLSIVLLLVGTIWSVLLVGAGPRATPSSPVARRISAASTSTYVVMYTKRVAGWGLPSAVPFSVSNIVSVANAGNFVVALRANGTVTA